MQPLSLFHSFGTVPLPSANEEGADHPQKSEVFLGVSIGNNHALSFCTITHWMSQYSANFSASRKGLFSHGCTAAVISSKGKVALAYPARIVSQIFNNYCV
jgi:hypothetical protein